MKVLHIFNEINFSGAEIMYANAAPVFQQNGIEMIALSTGKNFGNFTNQFRDAGIEMEHKPLLDSEINPVKIVKYFRGILSYIRDEKIDVIHIHRSTFFWFFALCAFICCIPAVRTLHNVFRSGRFTWLKAYFERYTARVFFNVRFQSIGKSVYVNERDYYKNPTTQVNNWYDGNKFYPATNEKEKLTIREALGISKQAFVIITAGRCTPEKGHKDIIKSLEVIIKKTPCVFLHLGCGELEEEEKRLARSLGVENIVNFLGTKVNVRDYLICSDVFIMPSKFEGLGNSVIEAMACQIPVILYDAPGLRDLIKNDDNGFLIGQDPNLISESVLRYCFDNDVMKVKANSAMNFVTTNFSMENQVKRIITLYGK